MTPVLIVGAGPAGLSAAVELGRRGIRPLLVERSEARRDHPRATLISTRSMELLRSWGLEADVRAGEIELDFHGWIGETLTAKDGLAIPLGVPTRDQCIAISPTAAACVPQDHLEPVLLRHARKLGARIELGVELVDIECRADCVEAVLCDQDGSARTVRARYVIGGDGAHSTVRSMLGIAMRGQRTMADGITALFHAELWELLGERRYGIYPVTHPDAGGVFVPAGRGDRWIYGFAGGPGTLDRGDFDADAMARRIRLAAGVPTLDPRIEQIERFSYVGSLADRFREGNAFLAGDAAHRVTPRGGTGMNMAIGDGYDLGWKLAWVLRGWAQPDLLDGYETERRPVAEHNVARSADPDGSVREVAGELHVDLGGRIPHIWVGLGSDRRSTLDLLGPGLTLFADARGDERVAPADALAPVLKRTLPPLTARALGIAPGGSVLVRPDGVPAAVGAGPALKAA